MPFQTITKLWPLTLLFLLLSCSPSREAQRLAKWGLPEDLLNYQNQLESLRLPKATADLLWLANNSSLKRLVARETSISDLRGLPRSLTSLDISYTNVSSLRGLPESIQSLDVTNTKITAFSYIPDSVVSLSIGGQPIKSLNGLPNSLVDLTVTDAGISTISGLPSGLKSLSLSGLDLDWLDRLPDSLIFLSLKNVLIEGPRASALPLEFPRNLQTLDLELRVSPTRGEVSLEDLPFPLTRLRLDYNHPPDISTLRYLKSLDISRSELQSTQMSPGLVELRVNNPKSQNFTDYFEKFDRFPSLHMLSIVSGGLIDFQKLPRTLTTLDIKDCTNTNLENLPPELTSLSVTWCSNIQDLRDLPPRLRHLDVSNDINITSLEGVHWDSLTTLTARGVKIEKLDNLPQSLRVLDLTASSRLHSITASLPRLESLSVGLTGLQELPSLPDTLEYLDISNSGIQTLKGLPKKLVTLRVATGQLTSLKGLPPSVRAIEFCDKCD